MITNTLWSEEERWLCYDTMISILPFTAQAACLMLVLKNNYTC
mgnify:CR=1 FL=1